MKNSRPATPLVPHGPSSFAILQCNFPLSTPWPLIAILQCNFELMCGPSFSVKKVRQVTYSLSHAKSGVSPKTRTFSLMFVQPDLEHQACLATKINLTTSQFNSSQNFAKSTCRLELEECPETVTMGGVLVFVSFGFYITL